MEIEIDGPEEQTPEAPAQAPDGQQPPAEEQAPPQEAAQAAPETAPEPEPVTFTPEQQEVFNAAIGRRVAAQKEAERQLAEARQQLDQIQPPREEGEPVIPPPPDVWEDGYEQKLAARDEAIAKHAEWKVGREAEQQRAQAEQQRQAEEAQKQMMAKVTTYTERAKTLGIAESDLQVAGNAVAQFGISDDLTQYILGDEHGPGVTMYLSRNLAELQRLQQMDTISAAVHIATTIKPKVAKGIRRNNPPPPPTEDLPSTSAKQERGPKGAIYE